VINSDPDTAHLLRLIFIPNYNASKEHIVVPSVDFNEQITLPGEEACTTISEKFLLNGALIIGSHDATNTHVREQLGKDQIVLFGMDYNEVKKFKREKNP
jgi:starch phosphorylase